MAKNTTIALLILGSDTVVSDGNEYSTRDISLHKTSDQFAIQINTKGGAGFGISTGIDLILEFSLDGNDYVEVSRETVLSENNTAIFDFPNGSGASYLRIRTEVVEATAALTISKILFKGKEQR